MLPGNEPSLKPLWNPSGNRIKSSNLYAFMQAVNLKFGTEFKDYDDLYNWSVGNIPDFWSFFWDYAGIIHSKPYREVIDDPNKMPGAKWFSGARLNFSENLLRHRDDQTAIIFKGEAQDVRKMSHAELYRETANVAKALKKAGVKAGDRVAGFMPNMPETIVAMLATVSLGAIWSSCSPDFGESGVLDRFGQIKPKALFTADGYFFKGKRIDSLARMASVLSGLPSVEKTIVVPYVKKDPDISAVPRAVLFDDFKEDAAEPEIEFEQLPFDHPLYIMFTSGTTGLPKCMVQSAGGVLVHHLKELMLHTNVTQGDRVFYFTTCGWMMWNWLVSSLAIGATVVLFDGSPFHPDPGALWKLAQDEKIKVFGTSAGYIGATMAQDIKPGRDYDLSSVQVLCSTGAPLTEEGFDYVYREVKADLQLASISGGSDINGCFALGNPMGPVYSGEIQCRGLAMKVEAYDENGKPVFDQKGELVCSAPFPSMPIRFWNDPENQRYHDAYFNVYPSVWRHGDFVEIRKATGGVVIYGRSDATLKPGGVRIGTAEIYRQMDGFEAIADSLVIGQDWKHDVRVVLFVKMAEGIALSDALKERIKATIRKNASPRHVPAKIIAIKDIPYTLNMKKVELAVKKTVQGEPVLNRDALANPESLDLYRDLPELRE